MEYDQDRGVRFLILKDVIEWTGLSRSTVYRLIESGQIPQPVPVTVRRIAFVKSEIEDWMRSKVDARLEHSMAAPVVATKKRRRGRPIKSLQ